MDLRSTQLKDTYGNLVTIGTTEGSPTSGGLQNGDGQLLTQIGIGTNSFVANTPLTLQAPSGYTDTLWLKSVGTNIASRINIAPTGTGNAQINNATGTNIEFQVSGSEKMRIDSSGNVGIGTSSPTTPLQVGDFGDTARAATFHGDSILLDGGAASEIIMGDGNVAYMSIQTTDDATAMKIRNYSGSSDLVTIERASGNVGIGTTSTVEKLTMGNGNAVAFTQTLGGTGLYGSIKAFNTLAPTNPATNIRFIRDVASLGNDGAICFDTVNAERMRIDSSGDIKFTSTQGTTLQFERNDATVVADEVIGQLDFKSTDTGDADVNASIKVVKDNVAVGTVPMAITFETGVSGTKTERMRIDSSGDVKIVYDSSYNLQLSDSGGVGKVNANGNSAYLTFGTTSVGESNATERMRIDASGNVGIGSSNMGAKFEVTSAQGTHVMGGTFSRDTSNTTVDILTLANRPSNCGVAIYGRLVAASAVSDNACVIEFWASLTRNGGGADTATVIAPVVAKAIVGSDISAGSLAWSSETLQYTPNTSTNYVGYQMELQVSARDSATFTILP